MYFVHRMRYFVFLSSYGKGEQREVVKEATTVVSTVNSTSSVPYL